MATPVQQRCVDYYGQDRFSTAFNRLSRIFTGDSNIVLSFDAIDTSNPELLDTFPLTVDTTQDSTIPVPLDYSGLVTIGPGICIVDDVGIHVKENYTLSLTNVDDYIYYPGDTPGPGYPTDNPGNQYNYYIILYYQYSRGYPPSEAKYYFVKNQKLFADHINDFLCLGIAHVEINESLNNNNGGYQISEIVLADVVPGYDIIARRNYPIRYPESETYETSIDGKFIDNIGLEKWFDISQCDPNYNNYFSGWEDVS